MEPVNPFDALPQPPTWLGDIKIHLRAVVGHSRMMQRSAQGDKEAMLGHWLYGTWGFVRDFPGSVEYVLRRVLHEASFDLTPYEYLYRESRTWWTAEQAHNALWAKAAALLGVTQEQLDQAVPTPKFAALTAHLREAPTLSQAMMRIGAVEQVGEECSRYWKQFPAFFAMHGVDSLPWIDAHLEHEGTGWTHEQWSYVLAELLHQQGYGPQPTYVTFCQEVLEVGRLFLEASDDELASRGLIAA